MWRSHIVARACQKNNIAVAIFEKYNLPFSVTSNEATIITRGNPSEALATDSCQHYCPSS